MCKIATWKYAIPYTYTIKIQRQSTTSTLAICKFIGFHGGCYSNDGHLGVYVLYNEHIKQRKNQGDHHLRSILIF
jgi:hypothetical protein